MNVDDQGRSVVAVGAGGAARVETWRKCYGERWDAGLSREARLHPAKLSPQLIRRVLDEGLERAWWREGMTIGDPFGGVGSTGVFCPPRGLRFVGMELEEKFAAAAKKTWAMHRSAWSLCRGWPGTEPVMISGDSARQFASRVWCDAVFTSPPFGETGKPPRDYAASGMPRTAMHFADADYGRTEGNLGAARGEAFWRLMAAVYAQVNAALPTGGYLVVHTKDRVSGGEIVADGAEHRRLIGLAGFEVVLRVELCQREEWQEKTLFGGEVVAVREYKGMFRRMAEAKGSPRIDHEDLCVARKVANVPAGGAA